MAADIIWNPVEFAKLHYDPAVLAQVAHDAQPVVLAARVNAPHDTGAGAASIRAEAHLTDLDPGVRISWDREHYYMFFHERGTRHLPARPFLVPALDRYL